VNVAAARRDQAAFAYRGAALTALAEVENALTGVQRFEEQIVRVRNREAILQRSLALAHDRYQAGYASYLEELDAQRNLFSTEREAIVLRESQLANLVTLYEVLGGGWTREPAASTR
jgi:multidrug efflux system outer membrane protein